MFRKRRLKWLGPLVSDEGFSLHFGYKGIYYTDERGTFGFSWEGNELIPKPWQEINVPYKLRGNPALLDQQQLSVIVGRIIRGALFDDREIEVWHGDFRLGYSDKTVSYTDERGSLQFSCEDGVLIPRLRLLSEKSVVLDQQHLDEIIERIISGTRSDGMTLTCSSIEAG